MIFLSEVIIYFAIYLRYSKHTVAASRSQTPLKVCIGSLTTVTTGLKIVSAIVPLQRVCIVVPRYSLTCALLNIRSMHE